MTDEQRVEALLNGDKDPSEKTPEAPPGGDPAGAAPEGETKPEGEPETAGTEGEQEQESGVDYAQEIPLSNGDKISLGELKDHYQAAAAREVAMIERENQVMVKFNELQEMGQYLQLPAEARQRIAQQQVEHLQAEHGRMLQAIPEWKDTAAFEKGRLAIFDLGKEYGVDLTQVTDHRVVKMLNDYAKLRGAIKTAKASLTPIKGKEPKAITPQSRTKATDLQNATARAKQTGNIADQIKAVDMLIGG